VSGSLASLPLERLRDLFWLLSLWSACILKG
jgi:hypothetical protein